MSKPDPRSDEALLIAARTDPAAFGALYRRHVDGFLRFFQWRGHSPEQALDLTAETFAVALESIDRYRPGPSPGVAWLYGICRNVWAQSARRSAIDDRARRALKLDRVVIDDEGIATIEALATDPDLDERVRRALDELPAELRDALCARVVDEEEYAEIARRLACSEQLVRQRVSRGLRRIRQQLAGDRT